MNRSKQRLLPTLGVLMCLAMACGGGGGESSPPSGTSNATSCSAGDLGCDCLPDNRCNAGADGEQLACFNGVCAPGVGNTSNGATTSSNTTVSDAGMDDTGGDDVGNNDTGNMDNDTRPDAPDMGGEGFVGMGLSVEQIEARACEVVLLDPELRIASVQFNDSIDGQDYRRGQRLAIAFNAKEDMPLAEGAVGFVLKEGVDDLTSVQIMLARCFGGDGLNMNEAALTIVDKR